MKTPDIYEQLAADEYWHDEVVGDYPGPGALYAAVDMPDILFRGTQNEVRNRFSALEDTSNRQQLALGETLDRSAPAGSLMRIILDERYLRGQRMVGQFGNCTDPDEFNERAAEMARQRWYTGPVAQYETQDGDRVMRISRSVAYAVGSLSGKHLVAVISSNITGDGDATHRLGNSLIPKAMRVDAGYTSNNQYLERGLRVARAEIISPAVPGTNVKGEKSPTLRAMLDAIKLRKPHPHAVRT